MPLSAYLDTADKTAAYVLCEMTSADGGFYSAQDADSEGVEGKFYTFTLSEILNVLGEGNCYLTSKIQKTDKQNAKSDEMFQ